jgi:hypothetical protein
MRQEEGMKLAGIIAKLKFRFDLGSSFLAVINLAFIVLAASDKITYATGLPARVIVPLAVPIAVMAVLLVGRLLDKIGFVQAYTREANQRNEMLTDVHERVTRD